MTAHLLRIRLSGGELEKTTVSFTPLHAVRGGKEKGGFVGTIVPSCHSISSRKEGAAKIASFPGLPGFCSLICGTEVDARLLPCIILNTNRRTKSRGGLASFPGLSLGMRLTANDEKQNGEPGTITQKISSKKFFFP